MSQSEWLHYKILLSTLKPWQRIGLGMPAYYLSLFHIAISWGLIERGASTCVHFVTCPDKSHAPEIGYSHLMCCCTKTCFQIPRLVFWSSAWGLKLEFFQYTALTSTSLSSENEGCSISTQTPELQDGCAAPAHLQTSLCLHLESLQRKTCCVLSGLLHHSTVLTQWKFS